MGRGRQKAMGKKITREIKYQTYDLDTDALTQELSTEGAKSAHDMFFTTEATEEVKAMENDMSPEELEEYARWAKESAEKASKS